MLMPFAFCCVSGIGDWGETDYGNSCPSYVIIAGGCPWKADRTLDGRVSRE
jgi:hypothetical protein